MPACKPWIAILFLPSLAIFSWLGMMLTHETGHILAAALTGGQVKHLLFHPLAFSRTDIDPNPHPLIVAWCGPVFGALLPLALASICGLFARRIYTLDLFATFCLLANGAYLTFGTSHRVGDVGDLLRLGAPPWAICTVGVVAMLISAVLAHLQGPRVGFPQRLTPSDFWLAVTGVAVLLLAVLAFSSGLAIQAW